MASFYTPPSTIYNFISKLIDEQCLQSISAQWAKDGTVTLSLSIMGDPQTAVDFIKESAGRDMYIRGWSRGGAVTTVTVVDETDKLSKHRIEKSAIFKSVYKELLTLHDSGIIPTEVVDPTAFPEADVYIKPCLSPYEDDGWTIDEILSALGIYVSYPPAWNYHVTKLTVRAGVPVVSFLQSIFPFPDLIITKLGGGRLGVSSYGIEEDLLDGLNACLRMKSIQRTTVCFIAKGDAGEVRRIRSGFEVGKGEREEYSSGDVSITWLKNLVGGTFLIEKVVTEGKTAQFPTDLWNAVFNY